jgi:hypothetical protein
VLGFFRLVGYIISTDDGGDGTCGIPLSANFYFPLNKPKPKVLVASKSFHMVITSKILANRIAK